MQKLDPWANKPFWASHHNKDELRRRDHAEMKLLRQRLHKVDVEDGTREVILKELNKLERRHNLTETRFR